MSVEEHLWFTDEGTRTAEEGHGVFVQKYFGLAAPSADYAAYAIRNLGWIEATRQSDGAIRLRYAKGPWPRARADCKAWLLKTGSVAPWISVSVYKGKTWHPTLCPLAAIIERLDKDQ